MNRILEHKPYFCQVYNRAIVLTSFRVSILSSMRTYMHDGVGAWRNEIVWSFEMGAPCLPVRRCLAFILRSFEQSLVTIYRRILASLSGTASHIEFSVSHSRQMIARFLPGARIGHVGSGYCSVSLTENCDPVANFPSNTPSQSCANFSFRLVLDSENVFL
jgi:hypothetical protein